MAGTGIGALLALGSVWLREKSGPSLVDRGQVCAWLCDRDGDRILGLDEDAFEVRRYNLAEPLELAPVAGGAVWVLSARGPGAGGGRSLALLDEGGACLLELPLDVALQPRAGPDRSVELLVGQLSGRSHVRVSSGGEIECLAEVPGAIAWCTGPAGTLYLGPGEVRSLLPGGLTVRRILGGTLLGAARTPDGWTLLRKLGDALLLEGLSSRLVTRWKRDISGAALEELARRPLVPGVNGGVWVIHRGGKLVYFDETGRTGAAQFLSQSPVVAAVSNCQGDLWPITLGGCLRLDCSGVAQPGQGGYAGLY